MKCVFQCCNTKVGCMHLIVNTICNMYIIPCPTCNNIYIWFFIRSFHFLFPLGLLSHNRFGPLNNNIINRQRICASINVCFAFITRMLLYIRIHTTIIKRIRYTLLNVSIDIIIWGSAKTHFLTFDLCNPLLISLDALIRGSIGGSAPYAIATMRSSSFH